MWSLSAFVSRKIDYSNSLFYGLKACTLNKLQRVQNYAARIVSSSSSSATTKSLLENLHWLDIKQRTSFKILLLVHKFFMGTAPHYFTDYLLVRCSEKRILHTKFMQTSSGQRTFEFAACRLWNRLAVKIRMLNSSDTFKNNIKTVLFRNDNNILNAVTLYN